jgi:hypothetical protein
MGFLDSLRNLTGLSGDRDHDSRRLIDSPDTDDGGSAHPEFPGRVPAANPDAMAAPPATGAYDREQWRKKLGRVLGSLPRSEPEWADLRQEAGALNLPEDWLARTYREEFGMMVRKIVADSKVTPDEHQKLDLARSLMGISDEEAESALKTIVGEAESFFGKTVEGARSGTITAPPGAAP